jgi:dolichyl-phosphate beta-glucosyltransferase
VAKENIYLSLVIPAFNEAGRLPSFLASVRTYLGNRYGPDYEVIIVDDGSKDNLLQVVAALAKDWPEMSWIEHPENRGKGMAVQTGMLAARGEVLLFADADGATPIDQETRLAAALRAGADLAVGSRLLPDPTRQCSRPWYRRLAGRFFAGLAHLLFRVPIRDTQCGFKMFRREPARQLFSLLREPRYLFDLELLVLAQRHGYRIAEVPIQWSEIPGGQFHLVREIPRTIFQLLRLYRRLGRRRPQ